MFLLSLRDAGVDSTAVDLPNASFQVTVGVMALVAEQEREAISQRTKAALAAPGQGARGQARLPGPGQGEVQRPLSGGCRCRRAGRCAPWPLKRVRAIDPAAASRALAGKSANAIASALNERG